MKLNIEKNKLGDFITLILFDGLFNTSFLDTNEGFRELIDKMDQKGMKSILFQKYFDVDPLLRSKYKSFSNSLETQGTDIIRLSQNEEKNESDENEEYKKIILETVKKVTGKENPNQEKVNKLTEIIINEIKKEI